MKFSEYTIKNIEEVFKVFDSQESGLSGEEAENRLKKYGFNELKVKKVGAIDIFLRQFKISLTSFSKTYIIKIGVKGRIC